MKYWPHWSSHYPILIKVMQQTSGDVLELGIGMFSTPLLHWMCFDMGRNLVSYEHVRKYYDMHKHFHKSFHQVNFVENNDWDAIDIDKPWSVAFVDHGHRRRREETKRLVKNTQFVIIHDTQPEDDRLYGLANVYPRFKYRFNYTKEKPWTTVLSNFVNLSEVLK